MWRRNILLDNENHSKKEPASFRWTLNDHTEWQSPHTKYKAMNMMKKTTRIKRESERELERERV